MWRCMSNPSTWKDEAEGLSWVRGQYGLYTEFEASLDYIAHLTELNWITLTPQTGQAEQSLSSWAEKIYGEEVIIEIKCGRHEQGTLQEYIDLFVNLMIDDCVKMAASGQHSNTGVFVTPGTWYRPVGSPGMSLNNDWLFSRAIHDLLQKAGFTMTENWVESFFILNFLLDKLL